MREEITPTSLEDLAQQLFELRNQFLQHNHSFIGSGVQQGEVISGFLRSSDYVAGSSGWMIGANDNCEFNSGTFRGTLSAASGTLGTITAGTIIGTKIKTSTGYTRIELTDDNYLNFYGENALRGRIQIVEDGQWLKIDNQQSAANFAAIRILPSGDFYIDSEGVSRLYIEAYNIKGFSTNFYPDTHNTGALGATSYRWANVWAVLVNGADYGFEHNWYLTESYKVGIKEEGIAVLNSKNELKLFIGENGLYAPDGKVNNLNDLPYTKTTIEQRSKMDRTSETRGRNEDYEIIEIPDFTKSELGGAIFKEERKKIHIEKPKDKNIGRLEELK